MTDKRILYIINMNNSRSKPMNIYLSNASGKALYEQIYDRIKTMILDGTLSAGEPLPTIRGLAKDLRISVITTSRAYADLERDGYIYSVVGKGSFVAERNADFVREKNLGDMRQSLADAATLAARCGLSREQFLREAAQAFAGGKNSGGAGDGAD